MDPQISQLQQQLDANRPLVREDFKTEFIPGADPNVYAARFSWPANRPLQITAKFLSAEVKTFDGRTQNSFEILCSGGRVKFDIQIISAESKTLSSFEINEICPIDFIVVGDFSNMTMLKEVTGRLYLKNGASITVTSAPLRLELNELIIQGKATIKTFDSNRTPSWNKDFKTQAPAISIRAKKATGLLALELNGVDGFKGLDKSPVYDANLNGGQGAIGAHKPRCQPNRTLSTAGVGGDELPGRCEDVCTQSPKEGFPGLQPTVKLADGSTVPRKGSKGDSGSPAVGTSKVTLQIAEPGNFETDITFNPGKAGAPGLGALPMGGTGGPPGVNPGAGCVSAGSGPNGANGIRGDAGDPVSNGSCEVVYISRALAAKVKTKDLNPELPCTTLPAIVQVGDVQ